MNWKYIAIGIISFGVGFLVGWHPAFESIWSRVATGLSVALVINMVGILTKIFTDWKATKLKKINDQLDKIYRPMYDMVKDFQKKFCPTASNFNMIEKINELETAFEEIKRNSDYEIDDKIWQIKVRVCFSLSEQGLSVLLGAINDKINELKSEKRKYV